MTSNRPEGNQIWHEDDHFWKTFYPILFNEKRWSGAQGEIDKATALLDISPPARICDLCCGPGRHSLELVHRGFSVTAVDRTALYLKRAKEKSDAEGLTVEFVQEDMRCFCRPASYDAVINLWSSFGYFEDPEDDRKVLFNIYRSLVNGGKLLMDLVGKEVLARVFRERDWHEENGIIMMEERKVNRDWSWIENRWILLKGETRKEFKVAHRLYSATELSSLLKKCGFRSVNVYGNFEGKPYDQKAQRLVVVAEKG